jgi:type II secretory pathway component PulC
MPVATVLLAVFVGWLGWRAVSLELEPPEPDSASLPGAGVDPETVPPPRPHPEFDDSDFIERPLFLQTRRPPETGAEPDQPAAEETPAELPRELQVTGVVHDGAEWFVVGALSGKSVRLRAGEKVKGWTVKEISPDNVVFESGSKTARVKLFEPKPVQAKPAAKTPRRRATQRRQPGKDK